MISSPPALQLYTLREEVATGRKEALRRVAAFGYGAVEPYDVLTDPEQLRAELDEASAVPPASVYRMFTPAYQGWLVSPGVKLGDKPAGYQPPVRNWARETGR